MSSHYCSCVVDVVHGDDLQFHAWHYGVHMDFLSFVGFRHRLGMELGIYDVSHQKTERKNTGTCLIVIEKN